MADGKVEIGAVLKLETAQSLENVGNVKQALREAQKAVYAAQTQFGEFSKEALTAAKYVAELRDRVSDTKQLIASMNPDAKFKAFSTALNGVTGGFSAAQGAMGLFGAESEDVQKTLLKVQSAMALSQGIDQVLEAKDSFKQLGAIIQQSTVFVKANEFANKAAAGAMKLFGVSVETTSISFKVLKTAIVSTGIGLLVIAISSLLPKIMDWISGTDEAKEAQERLNSALEVQQELLKSDLDMVDYATKAQVLRAKLAGKSEAEITKIQEGGAAERLDSFKKNAERLDQIAAESFNASVEDHKKANDAANAAWKEYNNEAGKQDLQVLEDRVKAHDKEVDEQKKANEKKQQEDKQHHEKLLSEQKAAAQKRLEAQKESDKLIHDLSKENDINAAGSDRDKELIKLQDEYNDKRKIIDKAEGDISELTIWYRNQKKAINDKFDDEENKKFLDTLEKKENAEREAETNRIALRKQSIDTIVEGANELATEEGVATDYRLAFLQDAQQKVIANTSYTEEERTRILQAFSAARKQIEKLEAQAKEELLNQTSNLLGAASEFAGQQTGVGKGLAVAQTAISTYSAAQKAYESQLTIPTPDAPIRATIAAAAAIATGLLRVKGILSVQVPKGGGSVSAPSISSSAALAPTSPANAVTTLDRNSINAIGNQAIKAFVVETDVTKNQERIKRINRAARIG